MKRVWFATVGVLMAVSFCVPLNATAKDKGGKTGCGGEKGKGCRMEMMKKLMDKDGDGTVTDAEKAAFKADMEARKAACKARRAEIIAKYDKDGDGKLTGEERKAAHDGIKAEMLAKFDKDGDGKLSKDERAEAAKTIGGLRRGGEPHEVAEQRGDDLALLDLTCEGEEGSGALLAELRAVAVLVPA